ncbi:MAG: drug/metabolite transporter (DMT)-like permease [Granulosicoccus sp.]|jgi:drug/metabolite transporter (DMT)-like permease
MKRWHANTLLLFAGAIWGMGFVAQASAMDTIGPYLFIALRFTVASLVILPFTVLESRRQRVTAGSAAKGAQHFAGRELRIGDCLKFVVIGLSLFAGMATQQVGLLTTSVTNSGFLTGLYVVFTPLLGVLLYRSKPHPVTWVAAIFSLLGIFFLSGGALGQLVKGDILTIVSAMFWGLQVVLIARFVGESGRPLALSQTQFTITALLAFLVALLIEPIEWNAILDVSPQILYAGIFASGFAFTIQVIGQRYTSAPQAAIFLSAEAPFAALFAFIFLNEKIYAIGFVGCALILSAILTVELVPQWQIHRKNRIADS